MIGVLSFDVIMNTDPSTFWIVLFAIVIRNDKRVLNFRRPLAVWAGQERNWRVEAEVDGSGYLQKQVANETIFMAGVRIAERELGEGSLKCSSNQWSNGRAGWYDVITSNRDDVITSNRVPYLMQDNARRQVCDRARRRTV